MPSLGWKAGEGYDLQVLRGGQATKSLAAAFNFPANMVAGSLKFEPQFDRTPGKFGVTVDPATGTVVATPKPTTSSRIEINNFLIRTSVRVTGQQDHWTDIRVHVHDTILDLWLTPSTLTVRKDAKPVRFTVLAYFNDGVIGDITDWPQLVFEARNPSTGNPSADVQLGASGELRAVAAGKVAEVRVIVPLPAPSNGPLNLLMSAPARANTASSWIDASASAKVTFVTAGLRLNAQDPSKSGAVVPNRQDPNSAARDSVASVVANTANILILSEGFSSEQDFNDTVNKIVNDLRTSPAFEPYKLLQDSINFWSVFIPSAEDDITLLGTHWVIDSLKEARLIEYPSLASPPATLWSGADAVHEVGLPIFDDPSSLSDCDAIWKARYGTRDYASLMGAQFPNWRALANHGIARLAILDERDTAFGVRNFDRPRASPTFSNVVLGADPRRVSDEDTFKFIEQLAYGARKIGDTWISGKDTHKRICFICRTQKHSGQNWGHFLVSTGRREVIHVETRVTARNAVRVPIKSEPLTDEERMLAAPVVAHEAGHSFGLADEYGDGGAGFSNLNHSEPNLTAKINIATTTTTGPNATRTVYDKVDRIKWLWPRVLKGAFVAAMPQSTGTRFNVPLAKGHGRGFKDGDIVRFRLTPVTDTTLNDAIYNFAPTHRLTVKAPTDDAVELGLFDSAVVAVDLNSAMPLTFPPLTWAEALDQLFDANRKYALVCPMPATLTDRGLLIADTILAHIKTTHGPLNAAPGNTSGQEIQVCVANHAGTMAARNIPTLTRTPPSKADIIGIYEGGGGHDCGVFRPAGRCKMRNTFETAAPLCHVCRYIIVDTINPTKHGDLDLIYPTVGS